MANEDKGTGQGITASSVIYKIGKKVRGMIDKSIWRYYRFRYYVCIVSIYKNISIR
jgi:hypothetical protein